MGVGELSIQELDFEAAAQQLESGAALRLVGNADGRIVAALTSLVASLHGQMCAGHARHVDIDISHLEFMNASCFNVFVNWLALINELAPQARYELRFTTNPSIPWQRRSLKTLWCFATDLVVVA